MSSAYERLVDALRDEGLRVLEGSTNARAQCPAHGSRGLTLALRAGDGRALLHCFAGCADTDVLAVLKLGVRDLFDNPRREYVYRPRRPRPLPAEHGGIGDPSHWCDRAVQQQRLEATEEYRSHLVSLQEWARIGTYPGAWGRGTA